MCACVMSLHIFNSSCRLSFDIDAQRSILFHMFFENLILLCEHVMNIRCGNEVKSVTYVFSCFHRKFWQNFFDEIFVFVWVYQWNL